MDPGVVVEISSGLGLLIQGQLIARGRPERPIIFKPDQGATVNGWGSITFNDASLDATFDDDDRYLSGSILQHCLIQNGGGNNNKGQIIVSGSAPLIENCEIRDGSSSGIYVEYAQNLPLFIRHSFIHGNSSPDQDDSGGAGIHITNSYPVTISHNTITHNHARNRWGNNVETGWGTV